MEGYREVAALLDVGSRAPAGLWKRIADRLEDGAPSADIPRLITHPDAAPQDSRVRRRIRWASAIGVAAAAITIALLSWQTVNLEGQLGGGAAENAALRSAAQALLAQTHRTVVLTSSTGTSNARVVIAPDGQAFWISSNLKRLPPGRTYQLWGRVGSATVSLGVIGADPSAYAAFLLQSDVTRLMVTNEPEGGTVSPTTAVLLQGATTI